MENGKQILDLLHPSEAFTKNLRAYISTVVSKWPDAFNSDVMFSIRTGPYQAAYRHL